MLQLCEDLVLHICRGLKIVSEQMLDVGENLTHHMDLLMRE